MRRVSPHRRVSAGAAIAAIAALLAASPAPAQAALLTAPDPSSGEGRVYELVSPPEKGGNEAGAIAGRSETGVARADGEGVLYGTSGTVGSGATGLGPSYSMSLRGPSGWTTRAIMPPTQGAPVFADVPGQLVYPAPDLSSFAFSTQAGYVAPSSEATPNLYLSVTAAGSQAVWLSRPQGPRAPIESAYEPPVPAGAPSETGLTYFTYHGTLLPEDEPRRTVTEETEPGELVHAWGFYEWEKGVLSEAGRLPGGTLDVHGAVPAASGESGHFLTPDLYAHQVSADGSRALFVSPDPNSVHPASDPVELYLREDHRTLLISRDELAGGAPSPAYEEERGDQTGVTPTKQPSACGANCGGEDEDYVYATPDGGTVFFMSRNVLALGPGGEAPSGSGPWTYRYDLASGRVSYVPGVSGPILASSEDGSRLLFLVYSVPVERTAKWPQSGALFLADHGAVVKVADLPEPPPVGGEVPSLIATPAAATPTGADLAFLSDAPIPGALTGSGSAPAADASGYSQVFRYELATGQLRCLSCAPAGSTPRGSADMSNDDQVESLEHEATTGWAVPSRAMSADGSTVFFDTPEALLPQDINQARDVYEWHDGQLSLISSGRSPKPSFLIDSSESGRDVFFATAEGLVPGDTDGGYDVYDARVGGGFSGAPGATPCEVECQEPAPPRPVFAPPLSSAYSGPENLSPLPAFAPSQFTAVQLRAKRLKAALAKCRKLRRRAARRSCERSASRRYGSAKGARR